LVTVTHKGACFSWYCSDFTSASLTTSVAVGFLGLRLSIVLKAF
jgi:hypothetical protein